MEARRHGDAAPSPAQWALARMLDAAFDDDGETADACLKRALARAGLREVPESIDRLLAFGREHLVPVLSEELGPRIVSMLFEDLATELLRKRSNVRISKPTPRTFRRPTLPDLTVPPLSESPVSSQRDDGVDRLPTIQSPAPRESLPPARPVIAIVEEDRWVRAPVARAFVQSGYDVLPLDDAASALASLVRGDDAWDCVEVLVTEIDGREEDLLVRALRSRCPRARVVAWTRLASDEAAGRLARLGVARCSAVARNGPALRVVEATRRLL